MSLLSTLLRGRILEPGPEPEIPSAMDDWDEAFKAATGTYPSFSRLHLEPLVKARAERRYSNETIFMPDGGYEAGITIENCHFMNLVNQQPGTSRKVPPA